MSIEWPTSKDVAAYRAVTECGIHQAKQDLERDAVLRAAHEASTIEELREILVAIAIRVL